MDIQTREALITEINNFKKEALKMHIVEVLAKTYEHSSLFDCNIDVDGSVIWYKAQARQLWDFWKAAKAQAVPEGFVLMPKEPSSDLVNHGHQVFLGHFNEGGQTGGRSIYFAYKAMIEAQEQKVTEMKINWGMECPRCNHNEAIIHSTAEKDSGYEFMNGDAVNCLKCGNIGEMDANGEDSDIVWNEDEAQEQSHD